MRVFGGADLLNALVEADIRTASLPETKLTALIIPVQTWNGSTRSLRLEMRPHQASGLGT